MTNSLQHFGVPGMRWGHRKAQTTSGGSGGSRIGGVAKKVFKATVYNKDTGGFIRKDLIKKDLDAAKGIASKILNNKAFKAMIYDKDNGGFIRKDAVQADAAKAKAATEKAKGLVDSILNNKAFKTMIYDKDNGGFIRKDAVKKDLGKAKSGLNSLRDKVNRNQYQTALKELASAKAKGNTALAKELQNEINDLFTPEEKKRYS